MLAALLVFLVGCLVLACVLYVVHLVMGMITLPEQIKQIALIAVNVFNGGLAVIHW